MGRKMKLRNIFSKANDTLGSAGYQLMAGSTAPFGIVFLAAGHPAIAGALFAASLAAACQADRMEKVEKQNSDHTPKP